MSDKLVLNIDFVECPICHRTFEVIGGKHIINHGLAFKKFKELYPNVITVSENYRKKIRENNLKKYGVEHPLQSEIIQNKIKSTCEEKYGNEIYHRC